MQKKWNIIKVFGQQIYLSWFIMTLVKIITLVVVRYTDVCVCVCVCVCREREREREVVLACRNVGKQTYFTLRTPATYNKKLNSRYHLTQWSHFNNLHLIKHGTIYVQGCSLEHCHNNGNNNNKKSGNN